MGFEVGLGAAWSLRSRDSGMEEFYTFWDNITHYKPESVYFWGLMNSATKFRFEDLWAPLSLAKRLWAFRGSRLQDSRARARQS